MYSPANILLNILFVGGSILLVSSPFLLIFYLRNRRPIHKKKPPFSLFMENFLISPEANALVFFWAIGEALVWFVIPEFLLFLIIFMRIKHKFHMLAYDVAGTIVGTVIGLYLWLPHDVLLRVPYVYSSMLAKVHDWYQQLGVYGLVNQPFSGVPYKVFLNEAHLYQFSFLPFLGMALLMRIGRYTIAYLAFTAIYPLVHRFVYRNYLPLLIVAIVIFSLVLMKVSFLYK